MLRLNGFDVNDIIPQVFKAVVIETNEAIFLAFWKSLRFKFAKIASP